MSVDTPRPTTPSSTHSQTRTSSVQEGCVIDQGTTWTQPMVSSMAQEERSPLHPPPSHSSPSTLTSGMVIPIQPSSSMSLFHSLTTAGPQQCSWPTKQSHHIATTRWTPTSRSTRTSGRVTSPRWTTPRVQTRTHRTDTGSTRCECRVSLTSVCKHRSQETLTCLRHYVLLNDNPLNLRCLEDSSHKIISNYINRMAKPLERHLSLFQE